MSELVRAVITQQGNDIADIINEAAGVWGIPPRLLTACAIAESALSETAAREVTPVDTSYGLWQQTVKYARGYGVGDGSDTPGNRAYVRQVLTTDLARAADIAAQQLAVGWRKYGDGLKALYRYNWPAGDGQPASEGHRRNYTRGWAASTAYVVGEEAPMATYVYPFTAHATYGRSHWDGLLALDVFDVEGAPILAPTAGRAVVADYPLGGHTIHLYHDDGYVSYWAHLVQGSGVAGRVEPGQVMGRVGKTGNAATTPPHCHLAIADQARGIGSNGAGNYPPWEWLDAWKEMAPPEPGPEPEEPDVDPWAEVERLNAELAVERSWSGATIEHVLKPSAQELNGLLGGRLTKAQQRVIERVRDRLSERAGVRHE